MAAETGAGMPATGSLAARAPAKINLSLKVLGRRQDGYHRLESRVVFASVGDLVALTPDAAPGLTISGPFAGGLIAEEDNLILKAQRLFLAAFPGARGGAFHLVKRLPLASGIGGGTADGAAALRLLARLNRIRADDPTLHQVALAMGADGPVCLCSRGCVMSGIGDQLGPPLPPLDSHAVLVNPGVHVPTPAVFAALGLKPGETRAAVSAGQAHEASNDLEAAAVALAPVIGEVLAALRATPGAGIVRMSGSGATCFALYPDRPASLAAAAVIRRKFPGWWVKPTILR